MKSMAHVAIYLFTVFDAILVLGKHGKIYSKCMGKDGSLMLDNLRKIDRHPAISVDTQLRVPSKRYCRINLKSSGSLRSKKPYF